MSKRTLDLFKDDDEKKRILEDALAIYNVIYSGDLQKASDELMGTKFSEENKRLLKCLLTEMSDEDM